MIEICVCWCIFFFFNDTATTEIYTLSLHDALPICVVRAGIPAAPQRHARAQLQPARDGLVHVDGLAEGIHQRSEEHTSELQSPCNIVCRLLLEKKNCIITSSVCKATRSGSLSFGTS